MALAYPEPPLTDGVVLLRPWEESDVGAVRRASSDEYIALIEHLPAAPPTDAEARDWVRRKRAHAETGRGWEFAVVETAFRDVAGGTGMTFRHPPDAAEPGVWVLPERRNGGIAERATRLLCWWALTAETGVARVQATVEPWNVASQRVLEKIGFVREGYLRSYASYRGERRDVFLYSLIPSDLGGGA